MQIGVGGLGPSIRSAFRRGLAALLSAALIAQPGCAPTDGSVTPPSTTASVPAQGSSLPVTTTPEPSTQFNPEQLDALLASIALYPDDLLMQMLMASTYPLEIVEAARWLASSSNQDLKGDALAKAVASMPWDPSVKSLVPFPQVLMQMNQHIEWTQQIGFAVTAQQQDVLDSIQRLRRQAQAAGTLKTTEQQVVSTLAAETDGVETPQQTIVIHPADPQTVYVPIYDPGVIYGTWPYPAYPPVYYAPPSYYVGTGLAFAAGVVIVAGLWGWAGANWGSGCCGGGSINVDRNRYNNISINNPNRGNFNGSNWRAGSGSPERGQLRPPGGPVGPPARVQGLPANAIGRSNVQLPAGAVNRPNIGGGGAAGAGIDQRPTQQPSQRPGGAFSGMGDGARAGQFQQRGAQSLNTQRRSGGSFGGGGFRGGGFRGGGFRGGGFRGGRR